MALGRDLLSTVNNQKELPKTPINPGVLWLVNDKTRSKSFYITVKWRYRLLTVECKVSKFLKPSITISYTCIWVYSIKFFSDYKEVQQMFNEHMEMSVTSATSKEVWNNGHQIGKCNICELQCGMTQMIPLAVAAPFYVSNTRPGTGEKQKKDAVYYYFSTVSRDVSPSSKSQEGFSGLKEKKAIGLRWLPVSGINFYLEQAPVAT